MNRRKYLFNKKKMMEINRRDDIYIYILKIEEKSLNHGVTVNRPPGFIND